MSSFFKKLLEKALCQYNRLTLTDYRARLVDNSCASQYLHNLTVGTAELDAIYVRCAEAYPEFDLSREEFKEGVIGAVDKYLVPRCQSVFFCKKLARPLSRIIPE